MDIQLIRTFLEVNRTKHFARAADVLCVTQAAVSARVNQLEQLVGAPLFRRTRNNIQLTQAGDRLLPQAEALMNAWNRLMLHTSGISSGKEVLALGCLPSISDVFFESWLLSLYAQLPEVLFQLELLNSALLLPRLLGRSLDIGLMYEPARAPSLISVKLTEMPLVLVCSQDAASTELESLDYVDVNWGSSFDLADQQTWRLRAQPTLRVESPRLAHRIIREHGGASFLPLQQVQADVQGNKLFILEFAEPVQREVFAVYHNSLDSQPGISEVLKALDNLGK